MAVGIISVTATYVPLYLAVDDGVFAKEGLQVDLLSFRGGSDLIKALVSGSVDVGVVSLAEVLSGIDAGQPLKVFYGGFNVPAFDWYATPSITSMAEARGKRFGVTQYGSSTDFLTRYALATHGLDPMKDVQIVQGGDSPTRLAAMRAGQIDVNIFAPPDTFVAAEQGYTRLLRQKDLAPDYPYHVFGAHESFIAAHPRTLEALLRGFVIGLRTAKADKARAVEALLKRIPMDPKYAGPTYDDLIDYIFEDGRLPTEDGLKAFFEMGIRGGRFDEAWPRERYWTPAFADSFERWKPSE
jgi:NitT/TauT family transport system substrate-binding protein